MSSYNYIVTAQYPTAVSHSCVGNFTGPEDHNLIVAKCTHIEVHLVTQGRPQIMYDVPIYGKISTLELFRPRGETQHLLLISTQSLKFSVLGWDRDAKEIVTRAICDTSVCTSSDGSDTLDDTLPETIETTASGQAVIIDPGYSVIGLHRYSEFMKVVPLDDNGQPKEPFNLWLKDVGDLKVLDIKFLYGCKNPTIAVLCRHRLESLILNRYKDPPLRLTTYEVSLEDQNFVKGPWTHDIDDEQADLLIPVSPPVCGVLVIGRNKIVYCSLSTSISVEVTPLIERSYVARLAGFGVSSTGKRSDHIHLAHIRVDMGGWRYLICDHVGQLWSLVIASENEKATGLEIQLLRKTFTASTISYLDNGSLYLGSRDGDSQLIKLNLQPGSNPEEVLERYMSLGPIRYFCVAHYEQQGQMAVVTCSGRDQAGSLRIVSKKTQINKLASADVQGIKGMWSLRSGTDDHYLVVSFVDETLILAMSVNEGHEYELKNTEIEGLCYEKTTLFCHDAINDQFLQVTSVSVRLVSLTSRKLVQEWRPPANCSICVATANASQVLLASGRQLYYLEIGDGLLLEKKKAQLDHHISCLHISPSGEKPNFSDMAAVGTWPDVCVKILSLPDLNLITEERFSSERMRPCSVLFCVMEEICYLFCGLGDGHLSHHVLDTSTNKLQLTHMEEVSLGTRPLGLQAFSLRNATHVFVVSDSPKLVYYTNKKLQYTDVNLEEASAMCPFSSTAFPDSLAFVEKDTLTVGTIGEDFQRIYVRSIEFGEQLRSIAQQKSSKTFAAICGSCVHLLDAQTFETLHTYRLDDEEELCYSIANCSFSGDEKEYYCVGTNMGSILVFSANDRILELAHRTRLPIRGVYCLDLYKDMDFDPNPCLHIDGDFIMVSCELQIIIYQHLEGDIKEVARYDDRMRSAFIVHDSYLGATRECGLITTDGRKVFRESHIDEKVNRFRRGSLVLHNGVGETPTIIFGTESGAIGMIASLPKEQYTFMEKLQTSIRKVVKGIGGFSHEEWRNMKKKDIKSEGFLDGDLIKSFLDLDIKKMSLVSTLMGLSVEELRKRVGDLKRLC